MSLKRNIIANYTSQLYVTGIGILILPLYIRYMGAEAYGLVGFFAMLQAWFAMLDLGLTPTIGRETARYHGGSMSALTYRQLLRALTLIFITIACVGGGSLWLLADTIAVKWLTVETLSLNVVTFAIEVMAISVALRWLCGLYRGIVTGSEKLVWLSAFNVCIATLRFITVFISMWLYGYTPTVFFIHQLIVAAIELIGLWALAQLLIPSKKNILADIGWSFKPVKPVLKFALTIAFTSSIWVLVTQTDKLILSGILPLEEYGYFTLAVLVASGIMIIGSPITSAISPRMARLYSENKVEDMVKVYRNSTQLVSIIAGSISIVLVVAAKPLLIVWTGDIELASNASLILQLYAAGNGFLVIAAFVFYLQYALGNLKYHFIGNLGLMLSLLPCTIYAASSYGGVGAGCVWLTVNFLYLFTWVAYTHYKLQPNLFLAWIVDDFLKVLIVPLITGVCVYNYGFSSTSIVNNLLYLIIISALILATSILSSKLARTWLKQKYNNNGKKTK